MERNTDLSDPSSSSVIELRGVHKTFRPDSGERVTALAGVDLRVERGDFVAILGPTGCGKTTLLNLVAGLEKPDQGEVWLSEGLQPGRNIPVVFQHYTLFPWRTILGNVAFGLEVKGMGRSERCTLAKDLIMRVGLEGFEEAHPHELSGGMRQRAAIAQALALEPPLLLMDEPFGAVDDATRRGLQGLVVRLWRERGMTVLFVTHSLDEALCVGSRVVSLTGRPGRIAADIQVDLHRPRDVHSPEYLERFIQLREGMEPSQGVDAR